MKHHAWRIPLLLALIAAGALGGYRLDQESLWVDEAISVFRSQQPWDQLLAFFKDPIGVRPLYWLVLKLWMALFGTSEAAVRSLSVALGVLGVGATYWLGRLLFGTAVASVAALWLATSPMLVWYMQEARMYTLLILFAALSCALYWRIVQGKRSGGSWLAYALAALGVILSHQVGVLVVAACGVHFALFKLDRQFVARHRGPLALLGGVMLVVFGLSLPYLISRYASSRGIHDADYVLNLHSILGNYVVGLHAWYWTSPLQAWVLIALVGGLFAGGAAQLPAVQRWTRAWWKPDVSQQPADGDHAVALLLIWLFFSVVVAWVGTSLVHSLQIRYTLAGLPPFLLLAALGWQRLTTLKGQWAKWASAGLLVVVLLLNGVSLQDYYATTKKQEFRPAASQLERWLETRPLPLFGIGTSSDEALRYYGIPPIHYLAGGWGISALSPEEVGALAQPLADASQGQRRFVLVVADYPHLRCDCVDLPETMAAFVQRLLPRIALLEAQAFFRVWVGLFERRAGEG